MVSAATQAISDGAPRQVRAFRIENLTKTYLMGEVEVQALRGVDIELYEGEFVVLLGPSGSGKSTFLNILGGLDKPTSGHVFFHDHELTAPGERELTSYRRYHVGFVFQFYNLVPNLTARENVAQVTDAAPAFLDIRNKAQAEADVQAATAGKTLADARLARARAELRFAESDLERYRRLAAGDHISKRELERAELEAQTRKAEVATTVAAVGQADFALTRARTALLQPGETSPDDAGCCVQVRAPASGQVLRVLSVSESVVRAGQPILEVGDINDPEIVVDLLSTDAVQVAPGATVVIEHWGGTTVLNGRVRLVAPSGFTKVSTLGIEEQHVNVIIDFTDPPEFWSSLGDGYRVESRIEVCRSESELKVPVGALFRYANQWAVFGSVAGRATLTYVEIGHRNDSHAQVLDGLMEGDEVIVHPSDRVDDGGRVESRVVEGG
jgi:HlyD family secretion protein